MPQLASYLTFDGTCAEAMRFYERTLGGKLETLTTHADSPIAGQTPSDDADRVLNARLVLDGGAVLMASDTMTGHPYEGMKGFSVSLTYPKSSDSRRVFDALSNGGKVTLPLQKTFWSEAFGMVVDRFGTPWMVNTAPAT
jgi:PhnB protein